MRLATFCVSVALAHMALVSFPASAQQTPGANDASPPPPAMSEPPPTTPPTVGIAGPVNPPPPPSESPEKLVPLKPVKAAPCTVYARETDGTTTCIGIPSRLAGVRHRHMRRDP